MSIAESAKCQVSPRLLLRDVDWRTYSRLLRVFAERPSVRLAYNCLRFGAWKRASSRFLF